MDRRTDGARGWNCRRFYWTRACRVIGNTANDLWRTIDRAIETFPPCTGTRKLRALVEKSRGASWCSFPWKSLRRKRLFNFAISRCYADFRLAPRSSERSACVTFKGFYRVRGLVNFGPCGKVAKRFVVLVSVEKSSEKAFLKAFLQLCHSSLLRRFSFGISNFQTICVCPFWGFTPVSRRSVMPL